MSAAEVQFRTATFGGFQKQDVMDYIERSNREHTERVEALQRELEEVTKARDALTVRQEEDAHTAVSLREQLDRAWKERDTLRKELEKAQQECKDLQAEKQEVQDELTLTQEELEEETSRIAKLAPAAQGYERLKDRTAGIELEAHQRAQGILNDAEQQADQVRKDALGWLEHVREQYGQVCTHLTGTVNEAFAGVADLKRTLDGLNTAFERHSQDFAKLEQNFQEQIPRMPEPLPLNEEETEGP